MSLSWDLWPGMLSDAMPPTSVLRPHIQALHHLDAELEYVVKYSLFFPAASSQSLQLPDIKWEFSITIQAAMVRILA